MEVSMILVEPGATEPSKFGAALEFVRILRAHGYAACVSADSVPKDMPRVLKYEAVPDTWEQDEIEPSHVVVLNAENVTGCALARLRKVFSTRGLKLTAIGAFDDLQTRIGIQSKIAFSTGQEPKMIDLKSIQSQPLLSNSNYLLFGLRENRATPIRRAERLTIFLPDELLEVQQTFELLGLLAHSQGIHLNLVTSAAKRKKLLHELGAKISVFSFDELQPEILAKNSDVLAFLGQGAPGARAVSSAVHLLANGGVVVDATIKGTLAVSGVPIVRGPTGLSSFIVMIKETIWPQFEQFSSAVIASDWVDKNLTSVLLGKLDLGSSVEGKDLGARVKESEHRNILIIPTNGVGLGHAQRSSLVAKELSEKTSVQFAAFPGCAPLLRAKGFPVIPLVSKSPVHSEPYANDLLNYVRLKSLLKAGDRLVFDGAFVFDSIIRNIRELELDATWIRRGLWQPGQIKKMPMERENEFSRVIVPGEAFDELNTSYSFGSHVHAVGPIVQIDPIDVATRKQLREQISSFFMRKVKTLVVSMLGGGVAADRSAQIQSLCALAESENDCLHLMVVWPHAQISPNLGTWRNSKIVRTQNALRLAQISDLTVSAAGYNSFHELLYHRVPTVFIPQMASYMDDQERRARSASDRGLAVTVQPEDLFALRREVKRLLRLDQREDLIRSMEAEPLPAIGNSAAAKIVEAEHGF